MVDADKLSGVARLEAVGHPNAASRRRSTASWARARYQRTGAASRLGQRLPAAPGADREGELEVTVPHLHDTAKRSVSKTIPDHPCAGAHARVTGKGDAVVGLSGVARATLYRQVELRAVAEENRARARGPLTLTGLSKQIEQFRTALEGLVAKFVATRRCCATCRRHSVA